LSLVLQTFNETIEFLTGYEVKDHDNLTQFSDKAAALAFLHRIAAYLRDVNALRTLLAKEGNGINVSQLNDSQMLEVLADRLRYGRIKVRRTPKVGASSGTGIGSEQQYMTPREVEQLEKKRRGERGLILPTASKADEVTEAADKTDKEGKTVDNTEISNQRQREIPEGGQSIEKRLQEHGNPPKFIKENPDKYYFDPATSRYKLRPEPEPSFSDGTQRAIPCFPKGTMVATITGTTPIENLSVGTRVLAFDELSQTQVQKPITALLRNRTIHLVDITVGTETLQATPNHRFWVDNKKQWIAAQYLEPTMSFRTLAGKVENIKQIFTRKVSEQETYNLSIADIHTYFIGNQGFLVHNADEKPNGKIYIGRDPKTKEVVYVGQTKQDIDERIKQHRDDAKKFPKKYKFKEDMKVEVVMDGLTDEEMDYHERRIYDKYGGEKKLKNRQIPMTNEKINALKAKYCN
jgi:hypothetical protein